MNPVTSCFCADVKHGITDARRFSEEDLIVTHKSQRERVDQRIQCVSIIKRDFATDSRDAKRVSVMSDSRNHAREQRSISPSMLRVIERSEAQAIHRRDRTRAHREDVAQNPADPSGRALERFDE